MDFHEALESLSKAFNAYDSNGSIDFTFNAWQCSDIAQEVFALLDDVWPIALAVKCMEFKSAVMESMSGSHPIMEFCSAVMEWIPSVKCSHAIMEFCSAVGEALSFVGECLADDFWENAYNSLTKLQTGEAYHVLLHNLIWSAAGLSLAIRYARYKPYIENSKEIKDRVEECKRMLFRYRSEFTQHKLEKDMCDFYPTYLKTRDSSLSKCNSFLEQKYIAYRLLRSYEATQSAGCAGGSTQHLALLEIDPHDIAGDDKRFLIGYGSYGYVWKTSWLDRTVAVKVFKGTDSTVFKKEASLLAALQNPFIVHMLGWFTDQQDGSCMLVMELAPTDLKKVIDKRPFIISLPAAVDIMLQISKGMEYLHKKKVIHRDLKPSNVLLEPSRCKQMAAKGYARVKLCDFGIAKVKEQSAKDVTQHSTFKVGTSYYRAPEVLFQDEDADKRPYNRQADVFSFAITCSEILAGKSGPACYVNLTSSRKIREKMLANVRPELPSHCPSHLADLINRCWATDPASRPAFSRVSNTLTYIKFILMRVLDVQTVPYASVVSAFDEAELKRRVSEDEEFDEDELKRLVSQGHLDLHRIKEETQWMRLKEEAGGKWKHLTRKMTEEYSREMRAEIESLRLMLKNAKGIQRN